MMRAEAEGTRNIRRYHSYMVQSTLNYTKEIGDHGFNIMAGASAEMNSTTTRLAVATDLQITPIGKDSP